MVLMPRHRGEAVGPCEPHASATLDSSRVGRCVSPKAAEAAAAAAAQLAAVYAPPHHSHALRGLANLHSALPDLRDEARGRRARQRELASALQGQMDEKRRREEKERADRIRGERDEEDRATRDYRHERELERPRSRVRARSPLLNGTARGFGEREEAAAHTASRERLRGVPSSPERAAARMSSPEPRGGHSRRGRRADRPYVMRRRERERSPIRDVLGAFELQFGRRRARKLSAARLPPYAGLAAAAASPPPLDGGARSPLSRVRTSCGRLSPLRVRPARASRVFTFDSGSVALALPLELEPAPPAGREPEPGRGSDRARGRERPAFGRLPGSSAFVSVEFGLGAGGEWRPPSPPLSVRNASEPLSPAASDGAASLPGVRSYVDTGGVALPLPGPVVELPDSPVRSDSDVLQRFLGRE